MYWEMTLEDRRYEKKETDLSDVSDSVNYVLNAIASDKSYTSVSIKNIDFHFEHGKHERHGKIRLFRFISQYAYCLIELGKDFLETRI